jgi:hypothetical protein
MRVGDRVVCVDDAIKPEMLEFVAYAYRRWVTKGKVYTIRAILDNDDIVPGILLEEITNPAIYIHLIDKVQEPAFGMFRFAETQEPVSEAVEEEEKVEIDLEM